MTEINRKFWCKNDRIMTGVLYGGVRGFWARRCSIISTTMFAQGRYNVDTQRENKPRPLISNLKTRGKV